MPRGRRSFSTFSLESISLIALRPYIRLRRDSHVLLSHGTPGHVITQSIAYQLGAPSTELFQAISCAFIVLMADNRFLILISLWKSNEKSGRYEKAMTLVV